jgi:4-amino-4-deoxy-L-arabinose transferase-like glycosyltransferase
LWWVLIAYLMLRLINTENPRWWLAIGAVIGLGMMTKFNMAFYVTGIVGGVLLTRLRRHLRSPWLWGGVALSLLVFLPHLIWQVQHNFIAIEYLSSIHARDVRIGRTSGYIWEQLLICVNPLMIPVWAAGLYFYFFKPAGRPYRILGWMFLIPYLVLLFAQGRSYYMGGAYPMLLAAGALVWDGWLAGMPATKARWLWAAMGAAMLVGAVIAGVLFLPIPPVNSAAWDVVVSVHDIFIEEIGWEEETALVAEIYHNLPPEDQLTAGILATNYGVAGALSLYGPQYGLPPVIAPVDSFWLRGYPNPPPEPLIVAGATGPDRFMTGCKLAGRVANRYNVQNEEAVDQPNIYICTRPIQPWPEFWESWPNRYQ